MVKKFFNIFDKIGNKTLRGRPQKKINKTLWGIFNLSFVVIRSRIESYNKTDLKISQNGSHPAFGNARGVIFDKLIIKNVQNEL